MTFANITLEAEIAAVKRTIVRLADANDDKRIVHWIGQLERLVAIHYAPSATARRVNGDAK